MQTDRMKKLLELKKSALQIKSSDELLTAIREMGSLAEALCVIIDELIEVSEMARKCHNLHFDETPSERHERY